MAKASQIPEHDGLPPSVSRMRFSVVDSSALLNSIGSHAQNVAMSARQHSAEGDEDQQWVEILGTL
jgi:hypothetical protein